MQTTPRGIRYLCKMLATKLPAGHTRRKDTQGSRVLVVAVVVVDVLVIVVVVAAVVAPVIVVEWPYH